jgi:glycerol uptake facilitator-like aquaporin
MINQDIFLLILINSKYPSRFMNNDQSNNISHSNKSSYGIKHKYLVEIVGTFILVYAIASAATV